jgi:hypothetical protein
VSPVKYELGLYVPEDDILHSYRRVNLKSCIPLFDFVFCFLCSASWGCLSLRSITADTHAYVGAVRSRSKLERVKRYLYVTPVCLLN